MKEIVNDGFAKVVKPYMDAQDKKSREIIAPVEVSPAEAAHSAGDQIIYNGILYDVIAPIAINDVLSTSGAGANISAADNIEAQIKATKSQIQTAAEQAAAQNKNTQEMIAPVEEDETDASRAYAIGDQLILDGVLFNVIDAIAQHGIITSEGAGANIEEADNVTDQLSSLNGALTNALANEVSARAQLGAHNLMPFDIEYMMSANTSGTWSGNKYTVSGTTYTVNTKDGTIDVETASGGATANNVLYLVGSTQVAVKNIYKGYKMSGCPSGGANNTYRLVAQMFDSPTPSGGTDKNDTGNGATLGTQDYVRIYLRIASGTEITTAKTFKPMLRLATDSDATYQPYSMTNQQITPYVQAISNPNLLDNPWFTVNQRGQNSYTYADANIYTVDRWQLLYSGSATRNADKSISLANASGVQLQFRQLFDSDVVALLAGKTVTLSAIVENYSGNNISMRIRETKAGAFSKNISKSIDKTGLISITGVIGSDTDGIDFDILISNTAQSSITVKALKLELGSVSTLARDTAPNYATELLKCQRYYVRYYFPQWSSSFLGIARASNNRVGFSIQLPVKMRAIPTFISSGTSGFKVYNPSHNYAIDTLATYGAMGDFVGTFYAHIDTEVAVLVDNELFQLYQPNEETQYIAFSADL